MPPVTRGCASSHLLALYEVDPALTSAVAAVDVDRGVKLLGDRPRRRQARLTMAPAEGPGYVILSAMSFLLSDYPPDAIRSLM